MSNQKEILGIFITKQELANMKIEHIHVSDFAIQTILKSIKLNFDAQAETIDKLVDRTPDWNLMDSDEQTQKMIVALTQETVIEYLRLEELIKEGISMVEIGIDEEGSMVVSAFYVEQNEVTEAIEKEMTEEELNAMEAQMNIFDSNIDLLAEAQKRIDEAKKNNVVPFQNRAARRLAQSQKKARLPHK